MTGRVLVCVIGRSFGRVLIKNFQFTAFRKCLHWTSLSVSNWEFQSLKFTTPLPCRPIDWSGISNELFIWKKFGYFLERQSLWCSEHCGIQGNYLTEYFGVEHFHIRQPSCWNTFLIGHFQIPIPSHSNTLAVEFHYYFRIRSPQSMEVPPAPAVDASRMHLNGSA